MSTTTQSTFDVAAHARAVTERDAEATLRSYADDAVIEVVDREHPPSSPLRISGREAIRAHVSDVAARDMKHSVRHAIGGGDSASLWIDCEYPDGTRVRCAGVLQTRDGKIVREDVLQEWDS
jgi:ketosteroid isomerase-like protein